MGLRAPVDRFHGWPATSQSRISQILKKSGNRTEIPTIACHARETISAESPRDYLRSSVEIWPFSIGLRLFSSQMYSI